MTRTASDPYAVLGVSREAEESEIKIAYRRLALQYHPDRNPGDKAAEERFKALSEAYATLRDPDMRARYDRYGSTGQRAAGPDFSTPDFSTTDWQTIFREADIHIDWSGRAEVPRTGNAVFDALFGVMTGMMRTSGLLPGEHREVHVSLSLEEARGGTQRRVQVPGPSVCGNCRGTGQDEASFCQVCGGRGIERYGSAVDVKIPPLKRPEGRLRLAGMGGPGRPPGDAFVNVGVLVPAGSTLSADGRLQTELTLTAQEAKAGARVQHLGVWVEVPPEAEEGMKLHVADGGLGGKPMELTLHVSFWGGVWRRVKDALGGS